MHKVTRACLGAMAAAIVSAMPTDAADSTCGTGKLWIPEGSRIEATEDQSFLIQPPAGFVYISDRTQVAEGDVQSFFRVEPPIKCSCKCESSSGNCSPSLFDGNCQCTAKDGCTTCTLTVSDSVAELGSGNGGGFVQLSAGVRFATRDEKLPAVFPAMLSHPEVQRGLAEFLRRLYPTGNVPSLLGDGQRFQAPRGYGIARLNVYGREAFVPVSQRTVTQLGASAQYRMDAGGGGSCSCTDGTCTHDSQWVPPYGRIHWCKTEECKGTCTLTVD